MTPCVELAGKTPGPHGRRTGRAAYDATSSVLEPLARSLAVPPVASLAHAPAVSAASGAPDLAALEEVVRRVSWGGDRRRGVARIELGGEYAGTAIIVKGDGREVALRVEALPGAALRGLPERLVERLEARGLRVTELEIG